MNAGIAGSPSGDADGDMRSLAPEAYRAMYENSPDGVLFTSPDGQVLAANPAACELLARSQDEICRLGRQGLADHSDERWAELVAERDRTGQVQGVARMVRGDGRVIDVEMSARIFREPDGQQRTCTILRDVTERVAMEREMAAMSARLHELTLTDELTGLRNRRGFVVVASQMLEVADRRQVTAHLLFLDVDGLKAINDDAGHRTGDAALRSVAQALTGVVRRTDVAARISGDEFVALALEIEEGHRDAIEQRLRDYLSGPSTVAAVGRAVDVSVGWAVRRGSVPATIEQLLVDADAAMYRATRLRAPVLPGRPDAAR